MKGIVLYSDGGTHQSNPGPIGYGVHGYVYETVKPKQGIGVAKTEVTDLGYIDKSNDTKDPEGMGLNEMQNSDLPILVTPTRFINLCGSLEVISTNNAAELLGMINALEYIYKIHKDEELRKAVIWCDSQYVVKSLHEYLPRWKKRNMTKPTGEPIPNKEYWMVLDEVYTRVSNLEQLYLQIKWIKGHSGEIGNEVADKLATMAAHNSYQAGKGYVTAYPFKEIESDERFFKDSETIHPFLRSQRLYFNPEKSPNDGSYYLAELGHQVPDTRLGKELGHSSLAIVRLNKADPVIEEIKQLQKEWIIRKNWMTDCIAGIMLDAISSAKNYNAFSTFKDLTVFLPYDQRPDLFYDNKPDAQLTMVMVPPYLSMRAFENYFDMENRLDKFIKGTSTDQVFDITDAFYRKKYRKGKGNVDVFVGMELKKEIDTKLPCIEYKAKIKDKDGKEVDKIITLTLGIDTPNRNPLKKIEELNPTVNLLVYTVDGRMWHYCTVITTPTGECGIWEAPYSANFLL